MKILKNRTFQSYFYLLTFFMIIELIFRALNGLVVFNSSLIRVFITSNILAIILGYLTSLCKDKKMYILNTIIVLVASFYAWLQLGFYNFIGVYMSVNTSSQLGAVTSYILDFIKSMPFSYYLMYLPVILSILLSIVFIKKSKIKKDLFALKKVYRYEKTLTHLSLLIIICICVLGFYYSLDDKFMTDEYQVVTNKELFLSASNPGLVVKEFGILPFFMIDAQSKYSTSEEENFTYLAYNEQEEVDNLRTFDDTNWQNLIASETKTTYNNLNNYFINNKITDKNEYTGLFEDKNLIVIMMESVNDVIINEEYFPNFYKLLSGGWYFENNYSPRNSCATGNNEFSAMTGLYSIYNTCTSNTYLNNTYFTSIFNLFNDAGYYTNSFHNFTESYYYRNVIHPNMGSQKYYNARDLDIPYYTYYGGWASDEDLMNAYLNILDSDNSEKFMSYITTVTSHQPYNSSPYGDLYLDLFKNEDYSLALKRYMSKLKVLDNALGILISGLEERGILDDTVIVLFGDHYPYGLSLNTLNEVLDRDLTNYENEKVPLVIYNSELTSQKYSTYTSYVNLTPTLANLFNLDYDPRLYAGEDILGEDYLNIVVFADSSWKNDKAYYNAATGEIIYYDENFTYTNEEIKEINTTIYNRMNSSTGAIKNNYFAYLEKYLKTEIETEGEENT